MTDDLFYIEVKNRKTKMYPRTAQKIVKKGNINFVVASGKISQNAKKIFDDAGIETFIQNH